MLYDFLSTIARLTSTSADRPCQWEDSSSELGLATGGAPAPAADQPAGTETPAGNEPASDESATGTATAVAEGDDDDADVDPLDLLTEHDEQEGTEQRTPEDRYKALSKRARKLERQVKKQLPTVQALREAGIDLRTLLQRHVTLANWEASMDRNPRLRALLEGGEIDEPPARGASRPAKVDEEQVEYPFDTNDAVGRFMANFHQEARTQQRTLLDRIDTLEKALGQRVNRIESHTVAQQRSATMGTWKSVATAAAEKLDPGVRTIFMDAMVSAAHAALRGEHRRTPQELVDHYLKPLNISKSQKDRASAAAGQRIAERNTTLPRRPGSGSGSPASSQAKRVPRLAEFNKTLTRMAT